MSVAVIVCCVMEPGNVLVLYFMPDSWLGNGVGVLDNRFKAKKDEIESRFARYMAYRLPV